MNMPTAAAERKALPVFTFLTKYFPLAFLEVVRVAVYGNRQHGNTGAEIRWARKLETPDLSMVVAFCANVQLAWSDGQQPAETAAEAVERGLLGISVPLTAEEMGE